MRQTPLNHDFILIGKTKRTFNTHSETQTLTEGIGNMMASKVLGFKKTSGILGTTWMITPQLAKMILEKKPMNEFSVYTEWPTMLWITANNPFYIEREGLEWEHLTSTQKKSESGSKCVEKEFPDYKRVEEKNKNA